MNKVISVKEAYEALGIKKTSLYLLLKAGALQSIHVGRRRLVLADSVNRLILEALQKERS